MGQGEASAAAQSIGGFRLHSASVIRRRRRVPGDLPCREVYAEGTMTTRVSKNGRCTATYFQIPSTSARAHPGQANAGVGGIAGRVGGGAATKAG